jgi:hypothetical protein
MPKGNSRLIPSNIFVIRERAPSPLYVMDRLGSFLSWDTLNGVPRQSVARGGRHAAGSTASLIPYRLLREKEALKL